MPCANPSTDRRKEPRFHSKGLADLLILHGEPSERLTATVTNVSRSGFKLELDEPVEKGSQIEIRLRETIVWGVVTNCERDGRGHYRAGMRTTDAVDSPLKGRHLPDVDLELYAFGRSLTLAQRDHYAAHLILCGPCKRKVSRVELRPVKAAKARRLRLQKTA